MKKLKYFMAATVATLALAGCSDDTYSLEGEGTVTLRATINNDVKVVSRTMTQQELSEKCNIWISKTGLGLVRKYEGIDNIPTGGIPLTGGDYVAEAWTGDSVPASFDDKYYKGLSTFTVTPGSAEQVEVVCRVANVVVSVAYDEGVAEVLSDYTFTVAHTRGELTFEGDDTRKGYFMMPNGVTDLTYTLRGKKADGTEYVRSGSIPAVKPTTEYAVTVRCSTSEEEIGGGFLTIEIDENELLVEDEIVIATAPEITGYQFDITSPVYAEEGAVGRRSVWVLASSAIKSVVLESALLNDGTHMSIGGNDVDLVTAASSVLDAIKAGGITVAYPWDGTDNKKMKISLETALLNTLSNGTYTFTFTATDESNRTSRATLTIEVSDAKTAPQPVVTTGTDFSARTATLRGVVLKEGVESVGFEYRVKGTGTWTPVEGVVASRSLAVGTVFTAYITGLEPGTTYEYRTTSDGIAAMAAMELTTEEALQLPNSGFEGWCTVKEERKDVTMLYASGDNMFWDSGNHGSAKMSKMVTTADATYRHGGSYSAKLASQWVGVGAIAGKFAAGNAFIGEYLGTDGTDGILGFGRPFTGRPVALKGYLRYEPVAITHRDGDAPAEYVKGDMDRAIIYIALLDDHTDSYNGKNYPVIIKTKTRQLFDKNSEHVIAYGELIINATEGSGMVEFNIPLEYTRTDLRPTYIMCTMSASKGGDYFTGGNGSNLWVDDLELVY